MNYDLNPGPLVNDVLFLAQQHRALAVFKHPESYGESITVKRGDRALWLHFKDNPLSERIQQLIFDAGFGGVLSCGYRHLDHPLINALVERWRPETHTFHLPVGEVTVTLQDINVLWGLPIEGIVVSGLDSKMTFDNMVALVEATLGFTPLANEFKGKSILSSVILREIMKPFPVEPSVEECMIRARLVIFYLIGCTILVDQANNRISVNYLNFLHDLSCTSQYRWGSAVLACLYSNLCRSALADSRSITGPVFILQMQAWERIRCIAPQPMDRFDYNSSLAARWQSRRLNFKETATHCLRTYRSQLQSLVEGNFNWTPYDDIMERLPFMCRSGFNSWMSACPLICWEIVEHHYPQRVMRQFNMIQFIPPPIIISVNEHDRLHSLNRTGRIGTDWTHKHREFVDAWNTRSASVVNGQRITNISVVNGYMEWYMERTVVFVSDPRISNPYPIPGFQDDGARIQIMRDSLADIYRSSQVDPDDMPQATDRLQHIQNSALWTMQVSNEQHQLHYPNHMTTQHVNLPSPPRSQRLRRRRPRRNLQDDDGGQNDDGLGGGYEQGGPSGLGGGNEHGGPSGIGTSSTVLDEQPSQVGPSTIGTTGPGFNRLPVEDTPFLSFGQAGPSTQTLDGDNMWFPLEFDGFITPGSQRLSFMGTQTFAILVYSIHQ